jgi:predicted ATPase/DNA-binding SARP family transcriptional activator
MSGLKLQFLGHPVIERDGVAVKTDRRKAVALLAYLAVGGQAQRRDALAALFWPDFEPERAYAYLRRALWEIHQMTGEGWVSAGRDEIRLEHETGLTIDTLEFERRLDESRGGGPQAIAALEEAVRHYRGDFLAGFNLRDSLDFDNWQDNRVEYYRRRFGEGLERLARAWLDSGQPQQAEEPARRLEALDPLNEGAQRLLIEVFARSGQRRAAIHQYERCLKLLHDELGVLPEAETTLLYEQVRDGGIVSQTLPGAVVAPAERKIRRRAGRLPLPATPFIGRKAELAELTFMLGRPECRLITLYGSGGIGKTRLALQMALEQDERFKDGVYFISLASLSNPDQVPASLAAELGFPRNENVRQVDLSRQVIDYLRGRQILMVMDNFEHLLQAAGLLSELLAEAAGIKIVVTSQVRLNLAEEWSFELGGLSFPLNPTDSNLEQYSSVQLFEHHAQRVQAHFHPGEADRVHISRICRLMEGLPLGIELAAAWVRVLSCQEIAAEIEKNLDFLETSLHGVPDRQRSLRAVFDHSWTLLTLAEQRAFRRLAVFQGGFTREGAAQVTGVGLVQLSALVDKSFIHRHQDGRYDLHESLRQYASEKQASFLVEQTEMREAHRAYYLDLLLQATYDLAGAGQKAALNRLTIEAANVRTAWYRTVAQGSLQELTRVTPSLMMYFLLRNRHQEALETFTPALERLRRESAADPHDPQVRALLVLMLAIAGSFLSPLDFDRGSRLIQEGIDLAPALPVSPIKAYASILLGYGYGRLPVDQQETWYQETQAALAGAGDGVGVAMSQFAFGTQHEIRLEWDLTRTTYENARTSFTRLWNRWGMAMCDYQLSGLASWKGEYGTACRLAREALVIYEDLDDPWRIMESNNSLGQALTALGEYAEARRCIQDALDFVIHMGNRYLIAVNQDCLAYIEYLEGDYAAAEEHTRRSLDIYGQLQHVHGNGMALSNLGDCAVGRGDLATARKYYEEALVILSHHELPWGKSKCLKMLGWVDFLEGSYVSSRQRLSQALALADQIDRLADVLETLQLLAEWYARQGEPERSLSILACLMKQPGITAEVRRRCTELQESLQSLYATACERTLADLIKEESQ